MPLTSNISSAKQLSRLLGIVSLAAFLNPGMPHTLYAQEVELDFLCQRLRFLKKIPKDSTFVAYPLIGTGVTFNISYGWEVDSLLYNITTFTIQLGQQPVVLADANVHDCKLLDKTLEAIIVERPKRQELEQHLCLDKGYDNPASREAVEKHQYIPHIRKIGEEKWNDQQQKRYPARRWVVERTIGWLSKCRAILVRYHKKACNYLGTIKLACALLKHYPSITGNFTGRLCPSSLTPTNRLRGVVEGCATTFCSNSNPDNFRSPLFIASNFFISTRLPYLLLAKIWCKMPVDSLHFRMGC